MGVIRSSTNHGAAKAGEPRSFWRRVSQALDQLVAQRSERAVPAIMLRRSRYEIRRCRRLMLEGAAVRGGTRVPANHD